MARSADKGQRTQQMKRYRLSLYTFGAVFLAVVGMFALFLPPVLGFAQRIYYELAADVNERQVSAMQRFVENRLAAGAGADQVIADFQAAVVDTEMDRGFVCLIDQSNARYLSHPDSEVLGMVVKPAATFDPEFSGSQEETPWWQFVAEGESASGLLDVGPGMAPEIIHFSTVPGTRWTVSAHENTERIAREIARLRRLLSLGGLLFGLAIAIPIPASAAARQVGRRYERQVERQNELEKRVLEAENARKTEELEIARQLQISMLPRQLPQLAGYEMAASMQTATEVGGDYYDVHESHGGELTLVVGDATGHGMKAGTMVTAVKSLFTHCAELGDSSEVFRQISATLKRIGLPRVHMSLALARVSGRALELIGVAMPPALIYRAATGEIEEFALEGTPLGSPIRSIPNLQRLELAVGDTVLLMSDGFPELAAPSGELLGYERALAAFRAVAGASAGEVVAALEGAVREWGEGEPPGDDVTFLVLRSRA